MQDVGHVFLGSERDMANRHKMAMECIDEVGIDKRIIEVVLKTTIFPKNDKKYREFLACSYKKQGYQTAQGHIMMNKIKEFTSSVYEDKKDLSELDKCAGMNGTTHGDVAYNTMVCVMNKLKTLD